MCSLSEEDDQFYDSKEYVIPLSDSGSDCLENSDTDTRHGFRGFGYEVWIRSPGTIGERREKLHKLMGLVSSEGFEEGDDGENSDRFEEVGEGEEEDEVVDRSRILENSGTVLRSSFRVSHSSSQSSISCCSNDTQDLLDIALEEKLVRRIRNLDDGSEFIVDEMGNDGLVRRLREVGSNQSLSGEEFERLLGLSPLVQRVMRKDVGSELNNNVERKRRVKRGWLKRLGLWHVLLIPNPIPSNGWVVTSYHPFRNEELTMLGFVLIENGPRSFQVYIWVKILVDMRVLSLQ